MGRTQTLGPPPECGRTLLTAPSAIFVINTGVLVARRAKETEAQRKEREAAQFQKAYDEGMVLSRLVHRMQPIGTDRNHNRYWVFSDSTPGLFVEKGQLQTHSVCSLHSMWSLLLHTIMHKTKDNSFFTRSTQLGELAILIAEDCIVYMRVQGAYNLHSIWCHYQLEWC